MRFSNVCIGAIAYELPHISVSSSELETLLEPTFSTLKLSSGLIEHLTGIRERRWWPEDHKLRRSALHAVNRALHLAELKGRDVDSVIYAGVYRQSWEPAEAAAIASALGVSSHAAVYDVSNACLGMLNGMINTANAIELGHIDCGIVVAAETSREIVMDTIRQLNAGCDPETFWQRFAVFTGGSGAAAIVLQRKDDRSAKPRLHGGIVRTAPQHHKLSDWGIVRSVEGDLRQNLTIDSIGTLRHGLELATASWSAFTQTMHWLPNTVDCVICHQVGREHQRRFREAIGIPESKEFCSYQNLGNIGSVSILLTAALAAENGQICAGDNVGLLGIGSGLNCAMLGVEW